MLTPKTHRVLIAVAAILLTTAELVARQVYDVGLVVSVPVVITLFGLLVWQLRNQSPYRKQASGLHLRE